MQILNQSKLCQHTIIFIVQSNKFFLIIALVPIDTACLVLGCYYLWPQSETRNKLHTIRLYRSLHCVFYCTSWQERESWLKVN